MLYKQINHTRYDVEGCVSATHLVKGFDKNHQYKKVLCIFNFAWKNAHFGQLFQ